MFQLVRRIQRLVRVIRPFGYFSSLDEPADALGQTSVEIGSTDDSLHEARETETNQAQTKSHPQRIQVRTNGEENKDHSGFRL